MQKIIFYIVVFFLFQAGSVQAATPGGPNPALAPSSATTSWNSCLAEGFGSASEGGVATLSCIPIVMQNIINFLALFAGVVAVFLILWSGYRFITSQGDPEKVATARSTLVYVLWGAIIVVISVALVNLVATLTGVDSLKPDP
jgi:hypothetical protein